MSAGSNTVLIFRPCMFDLECRTDEETLILSASLLEHVDPLILTGNEVGDLDWLRCVEGPPGPEGHAINVVNLSSRLMAKWDEPEACADLLGTNACAPRGCRCILWKVPRPPADDGFYVAIPSYDREPRSWTVLYVVYRKALSQEWTNLVIGVPTLWKQRNFITHFFAEGTHVLSMDDDVEDLYLCDPLSQSPSPDVMRIPLPAGSLALIAADARQTMQSSGSYIWSLNVSDNPFFMRHHVLMTNGLCNGFFWGCLNRHSEDLMLKHGDGHEDVERSVRYFDKDGVVVRFSFVCARSKCKLNAGGLQASMTPGQRAKEEERSAALLVEEFPHLLKLAPGSALGLKFTKSLSDQLAGEAMLSLKDLVMLIDQKRTRLLEGAVWAVLRRQSAKAPVSLQRGIIHGCTEGSALLRKSGEGRLLAVPWVALYQDQDLNIVWLPEASCEALGLKHKPWSNELQRLLKLEPGFVPSGVLAGQGGTPKSPRRTTARGRTTRHRGRTKRPAPASEEDSSLGKGVEKLIGLARACRPRLQEGPVQLALGDVPRVAPAAPPPAIPKQPAAEEPGGVLQWPVVRILWILWHSRIALNRGQEAQARRSRLRIDRRIEATHNLYVLELNMYLKKVSKKPESFQRVVQLRRVEAYLSEGSADCAHQSKRRDETCADETWLSVLANEYRAGLSACTDSGVEIPITRWDISVYYCEDPDEAQNWQSVVKHQSYVEGIELFDHKYFQIAINEARGMDPMQRHVLEVGAQNLFKMGITKDIASRTPHHAGVSVGLDKDDYDSLPKTPELQGSANVQAIIANRFSFIFNLKGPNYVADTACSASLTATHLAKFMLRDQTIDKIEFHIALGIHQCLSPFPFVGSSQSHMTSMRCRTFNATAGGYMRGDGCSGMTLKPGDLPDERDAIWRGSMVGQNGKSATLTAPNGISQEEVIWKAIREAKISPTESCVWSCHGTGTSLGDPIEVGAVRKVQNKEQRDTTLLVVTNKSQTGHLEGGAAMTSLLAAVFQVKASSAIPCCHLRQLNPHLDQTGFNAVFNSELNSYQYSQGNVHVSSFGFGGTNAHAIFWGENVYHAPSNAELYQKRIWSMSPPEVRVNGSDPALWDWDGPDQVILPGDKYSIEMNPDDPPNAPQRWFKEDTGVEFDEGEDEAYCITGPFNEWDLEQMEDGPVPGLWTITVKVPSSGQVEFRVLRNGNEDEVIYPDVDKCSQKLTPIHGPSKDDQRNAKNTWLAEGIPGSSIKIDFFSCRGLRSINWMQATPVLMCSPQHVRSILPVVCGDSGLGCHELIR
ncbi:ppsA [Symbiodinium natans]|uniref:PpsA protein n=1 Tax=Symbiodinium natans TaxID=878477 RepID=A0A812RJZ8_9DINO|nr:ppsA [Symbiodinium natans]